MNLKKELMEKNKTQKFVSNCCESTMQFVKNFLGMENVYFCNKCNKSCKPKIKND
jgi:hypothetical protein